MQLEQRESERPVSEEDTYVVHDMCAHSAQTTQWTVDRTPRALPPYVRARMLRDEPTIDYRDTTPYIRRIGVSSFWLTCIGVSQRGVSQHLLSVSLALVLKTDYSIFINTQKTHHS